MDDAQIRQMLVPRIAQQRTALQEWTRRSRSQTNRLSVTGLVAGALGTVTTAGPAVGSSSFTESAASALGIGELEVWQGACLIAMVVSIVSAVTAGLLRHYDVASRVGAAEAATIELDNIRVLLEFERIPVSDALTRYQQSVATVPFVDGAAAAALLPATLPTSRPTATG
ncbi:hypothetical protein WHI96_18340 [Pseudonocardia tropica]|uniref:SLATT domain-containing protein n=1 Tax=Pseudonocardia tropica TaxID=681289 RepID=A0ABV1JXT3_9PSEU